MMVHHVNVFFAGFSITRSAIRMQVPDYCCEGEPVPRQACEFDACDQVPISVALSSEASSPSGIRRKYCVVLTGQVLHLGTARAHLVEQKKRSCFARPAWREELGHQANA